MTVFSCVFFWTYSVSSFGFIEVAVIRRTHVILMYEYTVYSRNRWSVPLFVIFRASWRTLRIACNTMLLLLLFCGRITVTTLDEVSASVWLLNRHSEPKPTLLNNQNRMHPKNYIARGQNILLHNSHFPRRVVISTLPCSSAVSNYSSPLYACDGDNHCVMFVCVLQSFQGSQGRAYLFNSV